MSDDTLETLLEQWAAFIRGTKYRPATCQSAEKHYRPERVADDEARRPKIRLFTVPELWQCEQAVAALSRPYATLIRWAWVRQADPCAAARKAGLKPVCRSAWPVHRGEAFRLLRQQLAG